MFVKNFMNLTNCIVLVVNASIKADEYIYIVGKMSGGLEFLRGMNILQLVGNRFFH